MALEKLALKTFTSDVHLNVVLRDIEFKINETIDYFIPFTGAEDTDTDTYGRLRLLDTDESNIMSMLWNEDDSSNRTLNLKVGGGNRTLDLSGNLSVESASSINQDLTDNANVIFNTATLSAIAAESTDVDKFLVSNTGLIKYRTGVQVLSDIGAEAVDATIVKDADFGSAGLCATNGAGTYSIVADASANWNTAFGWGDHAGGGYAATSHAMSTHSDEDSYNLATSGSILSSGAGGLTSGSAANTGKVVIYDGSDHKITITSPPIAGDFTLTLPITDGGGAEALFTDGAGALYWDTPVGAGDVSAAANMTDHTIIRGNGGAKGVQDTGSIINDAGNWGINTTDVESWNAGYTAMEFQTGAILSIDSGGTAPEMDILVNCYNDGAWKYKTTDKAARYRFREDALYMYYAPSGTINNAISFSEDLRFSGKVLKIGDTSNTMMSQGITIKQGTNTDEILALKQSNVAHGCTQRAETDTYASFTEVSANKGGLKINTFHEENFGLDVQAVYNATIGSSTTKGTAGSSPFRFIVYKKSGTGVGDVDANINIFNIMARVGGATITRWLLDEDGDTWQGGRMTAAHLTLQHATSIFQGGATLNIEAGANGVRSQTIFDDTTASSANMFISGIQHQMRRETSAKKYKTKIKDIELDTSLIHNIRPRSYSSLSSGDDKDRRWHGLIADEIEPIYPEIVTYGENNEIEGYDRTMMVTLILAEVQSQHKEIQELREEINELKELR